MTHSLQTPDGDALAAFADGQLAHGVSAEPESPVAAHGAELELVSCILAGEASAWTMFVDRYSRLIYSVVRQHLHSRDRDETRSVFVDVLVALRRSKLRTYQGRAALSTWLTLVSRTQALDHLRQRYGRGARGMALLSADERRLFRWYYLEGRSLHEVMVELRRGGEPWTIERAVDELRGIEERVGDAWLHRLSYDLYARAIGAPSGRLLEYLDHVRDEFEHREGACRPEYHLLEREARNTTDRLGEYIAMLDPSERQMLQLRFERGWTAKRIAHEMGLESARGVYSVLNRIVRRLRRHFAELGSERA